MASNPYASPESDVTHHSGEPIKTTNFTKRGRLSLCSWFAHYMVLIFVFTLLALVIALAVSFLGGKELDPQNIDWSNPALLVAAIGGVILFAVMIWISVCQLIKRFHDINFNGWWVLSTFILVGYVLMLIPGREEANRYGAWRKTRTWEKVVTGITLLSFFLSIVLAILGASQG